ncbi:MAG: sulfotransferase [Candidatus Kuenenia sp.]|nr:sulfotransferase [Candidatus Kuenenia hertensis]
MNTKHLQPVIIIGMHRSGTTMLASLLEQLGLFIGVKKQENDESLFFFKLNDWLLRQANASWDNPHNFNFINTVFKERVLRVLKQHLKGMRRIEYLGFEKFLRYKDIRHVDFPWGWKDPRNTFTIDVWKDIFPHPKLLHIYRNPIDVANSARKREVEIQNNYKQNWKNTLKERFAFGKVFYQDSLRLQNIHEGIQLWKDYVQKAFSLEEEWKENILHIRYETFLDHPADTLEKIVRFIELPADPSSIYAVSKHVLSENNFTFIKDTSLQELYLQIQSEDIMHKLGYGDIINK